jgi:Uma2 family endonuclease
MTTIAPQPAVTPTIRLDQIRHAVLHDVSWEQYESTLEAVGSGALRLTFDNGELEIMSPLSIHERTKKILGGFIEVIALELNIPVARLGSTTFRRESLQKGTEPDECYYIQNELRVREKTDVSLERDPAPDLVIEVDITSRSIKKEPIYAAMGVLEVWRYDGVKLQSLWLESGEKYAAKENCRAFPWLKMADVERFLRMWPRQDETSVLRAWRDWVRETGPAK